MSSNSKMQSTSKAFAVWFKDLERWSVGYFRSVNWGIAEKFVIPISEVLKIKRSEISSEIDRKKLPIIEKISFGGKISITPSEKREGYKGRLFWANSGDFIFSKIRAKQGSFAIVPNEINQIAVSSEYPVFTVNREKIDGRYLDLVIRSRMFLHYLEGLSHGGSTKTRIPPEEFLKLSIPVFPIAIQKEIIETQEKAQLEIVTTQNEIDRIKTQIENDFLAKLGLSKQKRVASVKVFALWWADVERWSVMFNQLANTGIDVTNGKYPVVTLGEVSNVSYGIQKCPTNRPGQHARPYLRVANVQRGILDLREIKTINVPDSELPAYLLEPGDLLVCEGNSADLVGRPAIWQGEIPGCVHQNHILKVRVNRSIVNPEFILEYMHTTPARAYFRSRAKFTTNLASINSNDLRNLPLPLPPLEKQNDIVTQVTVQRKRIAELKIESDKKSEKAKIDIEAMILGEKKMDEA